MQFMQIRPPENARKEFDDAAFLVHVSQTLSIQSRSPRINML
jgi:hypothetical protein